MSTIQEVLEQSDAHKRKFQGFTPEQARAMILDIDDLDIQLDMTLANIDKGHPTVKLNPVEFFFRRMWKRIRSLFAQLV